MAMAKLLLTGEASIIVGIIGAFEGIIGSILEHCGIELTGEILSIIYLSLISALLFSIGSSIGR